MDAPLHPPIRLEPVSARPINVEDTKRILGSFIDDLQERGTVAQGVNTAVTVQLQKMRDAFPPPELWNNFSSLLGRQLPDALDVSLDPSDMSELDVGFSKVDAEIVAHPEKNKTIEQFSRLNWAATNVLARPDLILSVASVQDSRKPSETWSPNLNAPNAEIGQPLAAQAVHVQESRESNASLVSQGTFRFESQHMQIQRILPNNIRKSPQDGSATVSKSAPSDRPHCATAPLEIENPQRIARKPGNDEVAASTKSVKARRNHGKSSGGGASF
ncbi:hypothetical protein C0993_003018 [Termitomyces sp. T159_Od127]|nr:hypothetical protein C0993_003018 [Termitomyces sp. T159_Od127]